MKEATKGQPAFKYHQPQGIVTARIDPKTGRLANPGLKGARMEVFRADYAPTANSEANPIDVEPILQDASDSQRPANELGDEDPPEMLF